MASVITKARTASPVSRTMCFGNTGAHNVAANLPTKMPMTPRPRASCMLIVAIARSRVPMSSKTAPFRFSDEVVWPNFRFGSTPGAPYPDSQFPVTAVDELSKQGVPDVSRLLRSPNPTFKALSELATAEGSPGDGPLAIRAVSARGRAAQSQCDEGPRARRAGPCPDTYTDEQIKTLVTVPVLSVFGDHRDTPTDIPTRPSWQLSFDSCQALINRVKSAGGDAQMRNSPDCGIRGNSHMIMQDKNHLQIAARWDREWPHPRADL